MAKVVVAGYMVRHPVAGNMYAYFQYLLGLYRLGHEVAYVEESGWPASCFDPETGVHSDDPTVGLRAVDALLTQHGVHVPVFFVRRDTATVVGGSKAELRRTLRESDLILNVGGVCWLDEFRLARCRALVDMDPMFTQLGRFALGRLDQHDIHFTYGANIGKPGCSIPQVGLRWHPTVPPVVTDLWRKPDSWDAVGDGPSTKDRFTTVANWSAYDGVTFAGEHYGQKSEEIMKLLALPSRVEYPLELALAGANAETTAILERAGWIVRNGVSISRDPESYRSYVVGSRGEFSAAKNGYVKAWSGWFSDRSVCYLAAGLPVVLQDTGFSDWLPTGTGVLGFSTIHEAAACLRDVELRYTEHVQAARDLVERYFDYRVSLPGVLDLALGDDGDG